MLVAHYAGVGEQELRHRLFEVYDAAYAERPPEVTREALTESEFHEVVNRPSTYTWAVWDDDEILALMVAETTIERSPWISVEYLERQFPSQSARRKLAYVITIAVHPQCTSPFVARRCMAAGIDHLAREEMVMVFDVTDHLQPEDLAGGMVGAANAITKRHDTPVELVGITRYYVADFSRETA